MVQILKIIVINFNSSDISFFMLLNGKRKGNMFAMIHFFNFRFLKNEVNNSTYFFIPHQFRWFIE